MRRVAVHSGAGATGLESATSGVTVRRSRAGTPCKSRIRWADAPRDRHLFTRRSKPQKGASDRKRESRNVSDTGKGEHEPRLLRITQTDARNELVPLPRISLGRPGPRRSHTQERDREGGLDPQRRLRDQRLTDDPELHHKSLLDWLMVRNTLQIEQSANRTGPEIITCTRDSKPHHGA